jgi:glycoprotein endo-alpha-1,2-mannosidase
MSRCSRIVVMAVLAGLLACGGGGGNGGGGGASGKLLVGAHYYVWYPSNFSQGYLRTTLRPAEAPALGQYDSRNPAVAAEHISVASSHGIDFFAVDWWPTRPAQNAAIDEGLLRAPNIGAIRFCISYNASAFSRGPNAVIVFDDATSARFVSDVVELARRYFDHPSYLRVNGRPVFIVYLTRQIQGHLAEAMADVRQALAAEGFDALFIGDEIYWAVIAANDDPSAPTQIVGEPQVTRARLFDAITAYNLYFFERPQDDGYGADTPFLRDSAALYQRYSDATGVPLVPGISPGYNDRGTRLSVDHYAIPRRLTAEAPEGSFFSEEIDRIARPFADGKLRMVLVTSWNEWNEDTAIEPAGPAPATADDESGRQAFTQGYTYEGFDTTYVDLVRDRL